MAQVNTEDFFTAVAYSIRTYGIHSTAIDHYNEILAQLWRCPSEWLTELINQLAEFPTTYKREMLEEQHNGHAWRDLMYLVCGEMTDHIVNGRFIPSQNNGSYDGMTYFLEDDNGMN